MYNVCMCMEREENRKRVGIHTYTRKYTHTPREDGKRVPPLLLMLAAGGIKEMM